MSELDQAKVKVGDKWFDNYNVLWSVFGVSEARIECQGPIGVIEFFNPETLQTTSKFDKDRRLAHKFVDEYAPKPRKKADDQAS